MVTLHFIAAISHLLANVFGLMHHPHRLRDGAKKRSGFREWLMSGRAPTAPLPELRWRLKGSRAPRRGQRTGPFKALPGKPVRHGVLALAGMPDRTGLLSPLPPGQECWNLGRSVWEGMGLCPLCDPISPLFFPPGPALSVVPPPAPSLSPEALPSSQPGSPSLAVVRATQGAWPQLGAPWPPLFRHPCSWIIVTVLPWSHRRSP